MKDYNIGIFPTIRLGTSYGYREHDKNQIWDKDEGTGFVTCATLKEGFTIPSISDIGNVHVEKIENLNGQGVLVQNGNLITKI